MWCRAGCVQWVYLLETADCCWWTWGADESAETEKQNGTAAGDTFHITHNHLIHCSKKTNTKCITKGTYSVVIHLQV